MVKQWRNSRSKNEEKEIKIEQASIKKNIIEEEICKKEKLNEEMKKNCVGENQKKIEIKMENVEKIEEKIHFKTEKKIETIEERKIEINKEKGIEGPKIYDSEVKNYEFQKMDKEEDNESLETLLFLKETLEELVMPKEKPEEDKKLARNFLLEKKEKKRIKKEKEEEEEKVKIPDRINPETYHHYQFEKEEREEENEKLTNILLQKENEEKERIRNEKEEEERLTMELINKLQEEEEEEMEKRRKLIEEKTEKPSCMICLEEVEGKDLFLLDRCGHIFHPECIGHYLEVQVNERKFPVQCPQPECKMEISLLDLQQLMTPEVWGRFDKYAFKSLVETNMDDFSFCTTPDCQYVFIWNEGDSKDFRCPICTNRYCLGCKTNFHDGMTCEEWRVEANMSVRNRIIILLGRR